MAALTDDELKALQDKLNAFEPHAVHEALDGIDQHPLRGPEIDTGVVASGPLDFGSVEPGVLIYRLEPGRVRLRITVAEMTGGFYDEVETSDASVRGLVNALVAKLEDDGR